MTVEAHSSLPNAQDFDFVASVLAVFLIVKYLAYLPRQVTFRLAGSRTSKSATTRRVDWF